MSGEDADSLVDRVGVMVETAVGSEDAPGRVFGSVDVEHEFKDETSVKVLNELVKTTARSSGVRLGLGGELTMREGVVLRLRADYTRMGGGTNEYGGGVELNLRFYARVARRCPGARGSHGPRAKRGCTGRSPSRGFRAPASSSSSRFELRPPSRRPGAVSMDSGSRAGPASLKRNPLLRYSRE